MERAEDFNLEDLKKITPVNPSFINFLEEYLLSDTKIPLYILGPKGSGKTFATMKALSNSIQKDEKLLPAVFTYQQAKPSVIDPLKLASPETWGERYDIYRSCRSREDLLNEVNVIVEDDIHYRCEALVQGREKPEVFVGDLERALEEVKHGKKLMLISEDLLSSYAEKLKIDKFDEILPRFGEVPLEPEKYLKYKDKCNYLARREIPPLPFGEWKRLFEIYGVEADEPVKDFLYFSNPKPRAFVRFFKLFQPKRIVTIDDLAEKALEMLPEKVKSRREQKLYKFLLFNPLIETTTGIDELEETLFLIRKNEKVLEELYQSLPLIKRLCQEAAKSLTPPKLAYPDKIRWYIDPAYALRRKEKEDWLKVSEIVRETVEKSVVLPERIDKTINLMHLYYSKPVMSKLENIYPTIKNLEPFAVIGYRLHKYYMERSYGWVLTRPFQVVLWDILYEKPSLNIIREQLAKRI